jgi:dTDP-4-dehydrorhamnose reductase
MKVIVTGAFGQLGTDLCRVYADVDLHRVDVDGGGIQLDISDREGVHKLIVDEIRPDLVINAAAAHNVPMCQDDPATAFQVNASAVLNLATACREGGARLVHISTDYVFGYGGEQPYREADLPAPLSVYGASKLAGEHLIAAECEDFIIARTSAIYGVAPCRAKGGKNFVDLMLHLAATRGEAKVVTDEIVSPTYTYALAKQLRLAAEKADSGLYHMTCNGACSWYDFAKAIFDETSTEVKLMKATSEDFPSPVKRPDYSVLENRHLQNQALDIMPSWREGLRSYLEEVASCRSAEGQT